MISAGTCTLNADQGGDGSFSAAPQVQQTFAVAAVPITPATPGAPASIPTLSEWSVVLLTSLVAMFGLARTRRRG
nr:IPTL-CTERM sorting domain-containing protein [Paracidovorax valerianellae]